MALCSSSMEMQGPLQLLMCLAQPSHTCHPCRYEFVVAFGGHARIMNFDITPQNARFAPSGKAVSTNEGGVIRQVVQF
eukprot:1158365-Pelagomonas_calceolata.AAC.19